MAADRRIICTNEDGYSIEIGERGFSPFLLMSVEGVYTVTNNLSYSERASTDGADYLGSVKPVRNIILTFKDCTEEHEKNRDFLDSVFKDRSKGILEFIERSHDRRIEYYVENADSTGTHTSRVYTVSLICTDPFFYSAADVNIYWAGWEGKFEFPHEFQEEGEELGGRYRVLSREFDNLNAIDGVGIEITLLASDYVLNPVIRHIETGMFIQIGYEGRPFEMQENDKVIITTHTGNKHIYLEREEIKTEINYLMTEDSDFFQLKRGKNTISYDAEDGTESLELELSYRMMYARA